MSERAKTVIEKAAADPEWLGKLLERAKSGDDSTMGELSDLLEVPEIVERIGGNLALQAEATIIDTAAGENLCLKLALARKLDTMRQELAGPNPTAVEKLLVERVVLCWLALHDAEVRLAQFRSPTIPQADYWQRKIDHCHKRYLSAIKTLALIRKLAVPVLQVNIAKRQTNIAAGAAVIPSLEREAK